MCACPFRRVLVCKSAHALALAPPVAPPPALALATARLHCGPRLDESAQEVPLKRARAAPPSPSHSLPVAGGVLG
eukprot:8235108-Alexandrium_andersonii.AAC.1